MKIISTPADAKKLHPMINPRQCVNIEGHTYTYITGTVRLSFWERIGKQLLAVITSISTFGIRGKTLRQEAKTGFGTRTICIKTEDEFIKKSILEALGIATQNPSGDFTQLEPSPPELDETSNESADTVQEKEKMSPQATQQSLLTEECRSQIDHFFSQHPELHTKLTELFHKVDALIDRSTTLTLDNFSALVEFDKSLAEVFSDITDFSVAAHDNDPKELSTFIHDTLLNPLTMATESSTALKDLIELRKVLLDYNIKSYQEILFPVNKQSNDIITRWDNFLRSIYPTSHWGSPFEERYFSNEDGWAKIRDTILKASQEVPTLDLKDRYITWATGNTSAAIPIIHRVAQTTLSTQPALIPTGTLLQHNIVPLTGELSYGIRDNGVNLRNLSGVPPSYIRGAISYSNKGTREFFFNAAEEREILDTQLNKLETLYNINRMKVSVLRLLLTGSLSKRQKKTYMTLFRKRINSLPKDSPTVTLARSAAQLLGEAVPQKALEQSSRIEEGIVLPKGTLVGVQRTSGEITFAIISDFDADNNRYTLYATKNGSTKIVPSQSLYLFPDSVLDESAENNSDDATAQALSNQINAEQYRRRLQEIAALFDNVKPFSFAPEEEKLISTPFPIVWASCSIQDAELSTVSSNINNERALSRPAILGTDIQLAFTEADHVRRLQGALDAMQVHVRAASFETLHYIVSRPTEQ